MTSLQSLPKDRSIRFTASNINGLPFDALFKVEWRIANTDQAAYDANPLRGDFYRSDSGFSRHTSGYRTSSSSRPCVVRRTRRLLAVCLRWVRCKPNRADDIGPDTVVGQRGNFLR